MRSIVRRRRGPEEPGTILLAHAVRYGALTLVPVVLLGAAMAVSYRNEANRRGLAAGRSEAVLIARSSIEPNLDGTPLRVPLPPAELAYFQRLVKQTMGSGQVLRLRLRDLNAQVVFSDDGSGFSGKPEDEALEAVRQGIVAKLTHINTDPNDVGKVGPAAVEVYVALDAGSPSVPVGVLEVYLPYAPIRQDVASGMTMLYRDLAVGLGLLWLALLGISWSMSRGLRRQVLVNAYQAEHDSLTDLPNRLLFHRRAVEAVSKAKGRRSVCIAIVDLDRFKDVNDTLGHHNGDKLLQQLAVRLGDAVRDDDTVARLGGDEFGVILTGGEEPEAALRALREIIVEELEVGGLPLTVEASIGFVVAPDHGRDVDTLLQRADVAMYVAKTRHLGVVRYEPTFDHYDATNLTLVAELRHAIDDGQLVLHYQPKINVVTGGVTAVEALVRWQHPTMGLLPPDRFLPLVEQTELIDRLTEWVLERSLTDLDAVADGVGSVAVNISARNLAHPDFADGVMSMLRRTGVAADQLILEITETALLQDPERAARVLTELAGCGVRISLDDFGQGQTSLGYLSALPVDELKIDKSFVLDMLANRAHAAIVRSIVELGHNLDMAVVAEGVETGDVLSALGTASCDVAQGYYFARPMPFADLRSWLDGRPTPSGERDAARPAAERLVPAAP